MIFHPKHPAGVPDLLERSQDFPDIPLLKLPELSRIAPEFYGREAKDSRRSGGFSGRRRRPKEKVEQCFQDGRDDMYDVDLMQHLMIDVC